jgi:hypothetical protein
MSSAVSTEAPATRGADGIRPWQFFLLAGMLAATAVVLLVARQSPAAIIVLSLTVVSASLVALGVYRMLVPLVTHDFVEPAPLVGGDTRAAMEREKALALRTIKELEFDFAMGKVAQADYEQMSARLRARAMRLMRQLDEDVGYRAEIEREVAQRLAAIGAAAAPPLDTRSESVAQCTCGTGNDPDARFCKACGAKLVVAG